MSLDLWVDISGWIAAAAGVVANLETVRAFVFDKLGLQRYVMPRAFITVTLDADITEAVLVIIADPANDRHSITNAPVKPGEPAVLRVPAGYFYDVAWPDGAGIALGGAERVFAPKGRCSFHLARTGKMDEQGRNKLDLRPSLPGQAAPLPAEPSAGLLLAARPDGAAVIAMDGAALPDLDRAVSIVGLFETGSTADARKLFFLPGFGAAAKAASPAVGRLAIPISDLLGAVDGGEKKRLDALLGGDGAAMRTYAAERTALPEPALLRRAAERLVAAPEFWIAYHGRVLVMYSQAADFARQIGLTSERGRLLVFDRLVHVGAKRVGDGVAAFIARYPGAATDPLGSEPARIHAWGEIMKAAAPEQFRRFVALRVDTIVSGHGSVRGIRFDLARLGVADHAAGDVAAAV